ncbi:hypothetical protein HPB49_020395 [Dermacentor silvarum]|uniref:Uncharacterized protein n=1 Tax=Dermacentor silvarum TaxID=543639 RepID=A0ACB8DRA6_DERSI|nr:hypothetical protein HPB49_020395 [Dermacentor silvarum]
MSDETASAHPAAADDSWTMEEMEEELRNDNAEDSVDGSAPSVVAANAQSAVESPYSHLTTREKCTKQSPFTVKGSTPACGELPAHTVPAPNQNILQNTTELLQRAEEASERVEASAGASAEVTSSAIPKIAEKLPVSSAYFMETSEQPTKPGASFEVTLSTIPEQDNELPETLEGLMETLDETPNEATLFKKQSSQGAVAFKHQGSDSVSLDDMETDEGRVAKKSRWDQREPVAAGVTDQPTTSQQEAELKRKTKELRTVLLNGNILKVTEEEEDDSPPSDRCVNSIAPLPDGQFYNVDAGDAKSTPRAIYRKRDTEGVPVVFSSTVADVSFWDLNPNHFARDLRAVAGDEIVSHRMTNHGSLVIYVKTGEMARELLKMTTVAGIPVTVHVPRSYSKNMGKIRTVPFHYTESNLVTILARNGVVRARRQFKNVRMIDGTNLRYSRSSVVLTFRDDVELPSHVRLGFLKFPVEPYVEPPMMCRNCQGYWHSARVCHRPTHCRTCAGPHFHTECQSRDRPRCANCRGPHTAVHYRCPARREAYKKKRYELAHYAM